MNHHSFRASVRQSIQLLMELDLVQDPRTWDSLTASDEFKNAAFNIETPYRELYLIALKQRDYNVLMTDYSLVQFYGVEFEDEFRVRYAFYPNPFLIPDKGQPQETGFEEFEEYMQLTSESIEVNRRPILRFEVARGDYAHLRHPTAHLHLGLDSEARMPVDKALTPLAFTFIVGRIFFFDAWTSLAEECLPADELAGLESRYADACAECELLEQVYFSDHERSQFHFS